MSWKPKTIAGKILKGAVIGGGSLLGLATGIGVVNKVASGTKALANVAKVTDALNRPGKKLKESVGKLLTGKTKEERDLINQQKEETKAAAHQLDLLDDLINAGATPEEARAKLGMTDTEVPSYKGNSLNTASFMDFFKSPIGMVIGGILLLFVLPKLFKK